MKCASGRKLLIVIKVLSEQHVHLVLVPAPPVPGNIASANAPEPPLCALYTSIGAREASCGPGAAAVHVH